MFYEVKSQVLLGTVLGGSSLVRPPKGINYYLSMRGQDETWLRYKMEELKEFYVDPKVRKYGTTLRCNSCCSDRLTDLHSALYEDTKRKADIRVLDTLRDIGLAVWYIDNGGKTGRGRKNAYINTTKFGEDGTETVLEYFQAVGMPCNVNRDGKRLKVLFTVEGTLSLFKTIAHRVPTFMEHRL